MKRKVLSTIVTGIFLPTLLVTHLIALVYPATQGDSIWTRFVTPYKFPIAFFWEFVQIAPSALICASIAAYLGYRTSTSRNPRWLLRFTSLGLFLGAIVPLGIFILFIRVRDPHIVQELLTVIMPIGMFVGLATSVVIMSIWRRHQA